jgi:hypothetical protein
MHPWQKGTCKVRRSHHFCHRSEDVVPDTLVWLASTQSGETMGHHPLSLHLWATVLSLQQCN